jgi:uroporphyrinogen-III synthase
VLVTRPAGEAGATADRLRALGFDPVVAPFVAIRPRSAMAPLPAQAVLVTSGNALAGLAVSAMPLLAVGDVTATRARQAGFTDVRSAGRDAAALAALAQACLAPQAGPLLVVCGQGQGHALCADLRARGFRVWRRVTYAATPVRQFPATAELALRGGGVHAALFLSGETAVAFVRLLTPDLAPTLANVLALAIGKRAADALHDLPWRQVRLARTPTLDDVLALL